MPIFQSKSSNQRYERCNRNLSWLKIEQFCYWHPHNSLNLIVTHLRVGSLAVWKDHRQDDRRCRAGRLLLNVLVHLMGRCDG
jgi:hypothetical protein